MQHEERNQAGQSKGVGVLSNYAGDSGSGCGMLASAGVNWFTVLN